MEIINVNYDVVRGGEPIFEGYAPVELTKEQVKEVTEYIRDNHFSGELTDLPEDIVKYIVGEVVKTADQDMKDGMNDALYDDDEVYIQPVLPLHLINLLPVEVRNLIHKDKLEEYYSQFVEDEDDEDDMTEEEMEREPGICYHADWDYWSIEGDVAPNKENTLNLLVRQKVFDKIVSGEKTVEFREIKASSYKKFIECRKDGEPICHDGLLTAANMDRDYDIYMWNGGTYPFIPKVSLRYLQLTVSHKAERDTALVELDGFAFSPLVVSETGKAARFTLTRDAFKLSNRGRYCFWNIELHIKRVVEVKRAEK